jgi:hypothetical protein
LVVVVVVLFAQDLRVIVFWVLFWVSVVISGLFGCCCGCGPFSIDRLFENQKAIKFTLNN